MNIFIQQTTLKRIRKENKLSLRKLSALSGIGVSYLHELENRQNYVKQGELERIAAVLNVTTELLGKDLLWPKRERGYSGASERKKVLSCRSVQAALE